MANFRELLAEHQRDIVIAALTMYSNRCKVNATRKLQGYGTVREEVKRQEWYKRHEETEKVLSIIVEECD